MKKLIEFCKKHIEIISYVFFGALTTLVNFAVYTVAVELLLWSVTVSNAVSWVIAVSFAFAVNKLFVFKSRRKTVWGTVLEAFGFLSSRVASGLIEVFLPALLIKIGLDGDVFGIDGMVAKLIVNVIVIVFNYVAGKLIVFRKGKNE